MAPAPTEPSHPLRAGFRSKGLRLVQSAATQPPVWAVLTEAVVGEEETFVVWLCEEAEGAGLAIPA